MTQLFSGSLNYSGIQDAQYGVLMNEYLASSEAGRQQAAYNLNILAAEDAAIVPLCYKQRWVITHVGVVSGMTPGQSGPYGGALTWRVDPQSR